MSRDVTYHQKWLNKLAEVRSHRRSLMKLKFILDLSVPDNPDKV